MLKAGWDSFLRGKILIQCSTAWCPTHYFQCKVAQLDGVANFHGTFDGAFYTAKVATRRPRVLRWYCGEAFGCSCCRGRESLSLVVCGLGRKRFALSALQDQSAHVESANNVSREQPLLIAIAQPGRNEIKQLIGEIVEDEFLKARH